MDRCRWTRGHTIGRGSSATVSLATTRRTSDEVFAVKSTELSESEFLQKEQRILSQLNCPRIVGYMGSDVTFENGKLMYNIFMEYVPGGTLSDEIQNRGGCLDKCMIGSHTRSILQGLEYLHSNGLVHCDIKGRNVLIGKDGAKIADLGCARWVDGVSGEATPMRFSGTPAFMAPEVARGEEQGCPADVWALGCTVIEMATGRAPWPDVVDPVSALYRVAFTEDVPEIPSFLGEQAKDFLSKCLVRDPESRWTVNQLLEHPFLDEPGSSSKRIQESSSWNSPTSVLNQGFWDSMDDSETATTTTQDRSQSFLLNSRAERIWRLLNTGVSSSPRLPNWTWEGDWVSVRSIEDGEVSCSRGRDMIPVDETATTTGSVRVPFSIEEDMESSVVNEGRFHYSLNSFRTSNISRTGRSFEIDCKCTENVAVRSKLHFGRCEGDLYSPILN